MPLAPDLAALLAQALERVGSPTRVLARPGLGFGSRLLDERALVLGGVPAPGFLSREPNGRLGLSDQIPFCLVLREPRLLLTPALGGEVEDWLPLFEELAREDEALLIVAEQAALDELLATLLINSEREILQVGVAAPGQPLPTLAGAIAAASGSSPENFVTPAEQAPDEHVRIALPLVEAAYLRQDASFLFPLEGQEWGAALEPIAILEVGGRDREERAERVRALGEALRQG